MKIESKYFYKLFHVLDEFNRMTLYMLTMFDGRVLRSIKHKNEHDGQLEILAQLEE
jgi:hypothetical protein